MLMNTLTLKGVLSSVLISGTLLLVGCGSDNDSSGGGGGVIGETLEVIPAPGAVFSGAAADPSAMGPYTVAEYEYDFGRIELYDDKRDFSYQSTLHGYIQYPENEEGPWPVVLLLHGRHGVCYSGEWGQPYEECQDPIPSYRGYEYLSRNLVSHGYAVISVDANYINANDSGPSNGDAGALERAQLVVRHLDEFRNINTSGGWGMDNLVGKLDMDHIGIMGHSRGGEGVNRTVIYNRNQVHPHNIVAVFSLAPTDYNTLTVNNVNFAALAGYCDGDVEDLMGNFAFDTSRYAVESDPFPKFQLISMGANHNFYNTKWADPDLEGRPDDWTYWDSDQTDPQCGTNAATNSRDSRELQQAQGLFFMASFFRAFVGGETEFAQYWNGQATVPANICPDGVGPCDDRYLLSIHAPSENRLVIDDTQDAASLFINNLGGFVIFDGFSYFDICQTNRRPGEGCPVAEPTFNTAEQIYMSWDAPATYSSELMGVDVTPYQILSMRIGISLGDEDNLNGQNFSIVLEDMEGNTSKVTASDYSDALFYPPGRPFAENGSRKTVLNAVDIPLTAFAGIDYQNLYSVSLAFDQTPAGTVQMTDLMFQKVE